MLKKVFLVRIVTSTPMKHPYTLYILQCSDGTLYTGITTDMERRLYEHNSSTLGAKYTRARRPVSVVYSAVFPNRSIATAEESRIKKLSRAEKMSMIQRGCLDGDMDE